MSEGYYAAAERARLEQELEAMRREAHSARPLLASYGADLLTIAKVLRAAGCEGESAVEVAQDAARRLGLIRYAADVCDRLTREVCAGWTWRVDGTVPVWTHGSVEVWQSTDRDLVPLAGCCYFLDPSSSHDEEQYDSLEEVVARARRMRLGPRRLDGSR